MNAARRSRPPWLALAASPVAWFTYEQGLGAVVRLSCGSNPSVGILWGLGAALVCVVAGVAAARAGLAGSRSRSPSEQAVSSRIMGAPQFIGFLGAGAAAVMALAIVYQALATLIVPPCAR